MSKTITISDETYKRLKDQLEDKEVKEKKETKIQIKTVAGSVLFESNKTTLKEAVVEAVDEGADLTGANLTGADLTGANLTDANLPGANLPGADLPGANLTDADFYHAKFYGRDGNTKINKDQLDDFLEALGIVIIEKEK